MTAQPQSTTSASSATDVVAQGALIAGQVVTVFFLTFFLLLSDDMYKRKLMSLAGPRLERRRVTLQIIQSIGSQIERFLLVLVFTSALVAVATWLALAWMGVRHAVVWGLMAGLFNTIPFFGPIIVTVMLGTVAFAEFGTLSQAAAAAGVALLITTLEGYLLTPILMSRAARMNAIVVFISILFWSWVWGIAGTLLAVPVMMAIKTVCDGVEGWQWLGELLGDYERPKLRNSEGG
jgi:predicted PurR-regulated permease PerM